MTVVWQSDELMAATGGALSGKPFEAFSVAIDSRKVQPGGLFIALKGDRVDGHEYLKEAFDRGAAGALVHRVPEGAGGLGSLVQVGDTYKALLDIAVAARKRTCAVIIAVTGSVGKTGAKEAIRIAAASMGEVYATQGNLNNHIGLPLSLANLAQAARFGVFELGMNHMGEISFLSRIVRPDIAVITNIEAVHLEFFPHIEAIADAKAEILEGMNADGAIILNRDNRYYDRLAAHAQRHGVTRILTFGSSEGSDFRLLDYRLDGLGSEVEADARGTLIRYRLGTIGRHWALTSLAALAALDAAGADLADAAAALAHFHEPEGRGRLHRIQLPQGAITLIDDCYNASPSSMAAGIAKLAELKDGMDGAKRSVAILGDMLELGVTSADLHTAIAGQLERHRIDLVCAAGPLMQHLFQATSESRRGIHAANAQLLAPIVLPLLRDGDVVLLKGSRGSRMDVIRDALANASATLREAEHAV